MEYLKSIGEFFWAVVNNWAGYCTGGVIVALLWLWSTLKGTPISRRFGIAIAILFLLCAFFNAWRDQKTFADNMAQQLHNLQDPNLKVRIGFVTIGVVDGSPMFIISAVVGNDGAPSAAYVKQLDITLGSGKIFRADRVLPPEERVVISRNGVGRDLILLRQDLLSAKLMNGTIPLHGLVDGWMPFAIPPGFTKEDVAKGAQIVMTVSDANDKATASKPFLFGSVQSHSN